MTNALAPIDAHSRFLPHAFSGRIRYCSSAKPLSPGPSAFTWSFTSTHSLPITPHRVFCLFFCLSGGSFSCWAHLPAYRAWIPIGILFSLSCLSKYHVFQDVQVSVKCILTFIHLFASHQEALLIWRKTSLALVRNRDYCIELTPESFTNSLTQCLKSRNVNLSFWTSLFSFLERDHTYLSCLNKEYVMIN